MFTAQQLKKYYNNKLYHKNDSNDNAEAKHHFQGITTLTWKLCASCDGTQGIMIVSDKKPSLLGKKSTVLGMYYYVRFVQMC